VIWNHISKDTRKQILERRLFPGLILHVYCSFPNPPKYKFLIYSVCLKGDGPPSGLPGHGGVSGIAGGSPGEADLDPSDLREKDPGKEISSLRIPGRKIELHLERIGIPEGLSLALPFDPREALRVRPVKGLPNGPVQVPEGLLLGLRGTVCEKAVLLARAPQGQELGQVPAGEKRDPGVEAFFLEIEGLFHTNRTHPAWRFKRASCSGVGTRRNLKASIVFMISILSQGEARLISPA